MTASPAFAELKAKQRALRDGFHENLSLRIHRALSWLARAEVCGDDDDARFIYLWIAFNAAYSEENGDSALAAARGLFEAYFGKLLRLDVKSRIYNTVWQSFSGPIRLLLDNKYVYHRFWSYQNQVPGHEDWEKRFAAARQRAQQALARQDTQLVLTSLFDRLYVLRNQIMHGGATWNSSVNRAQVRDGAAIMAMLVPLFIDLMMDDPATVWGKAHYPVVS
jgi:hypothetical protein